MINKREAVLSLLDAGRSPTYIPAAFFLHFDPADHAGQRAVEKHLEFFRATDMDFVKIQYERAFPPVPEIHRPEDWAMMPFYGPDFYQPQLSAVEGLVKAAKPEALVIQTLYSPFMMAGQAVGAENAVRHMIENPAAVKKGMQIITESLLGFMRECLRLGVDGFYTSTQGGEAGRLPDRSLFDECIRPYDLEIMGEADRSGLFNILHVCDYHLPYTDLRPYADYPGKVVSAPLKLTDRRLTPGEVERLFKRPYFGGLERMGVIATGSREEARRAAEETLAEASPRFMLGTDCTAPSETPWENLRAAVEAAHAYARG